MRHHSAAAFILAAALLATLSATEAAPPTVPVIICSQDAAAVTSHLITKPAGLAANDIWIACVTFNGTRTADWSASGLTELSDETLGAAVSLSCAWKRATGSEGATVTMSSNAAIDSEQCSIRIAGAHTTEAPYPNQTQFATLTGGGTDPNPAAVTPTWGAADTLYIVAVGSAVNVTYAALTGYTCQDAPSSISLDMRLCYKATTNTTTDDPALFDQSPDTTWIARTFAVRPAAAASPCSDARLAITGIGC
jgi:hypothetical protein